MIDRAALLDTLLADPRRVAEVSPEDAEELTVACAALIVALSRRRTQAPRAVPVEDGPLLTVEDVMKLTGFTRRAIYAMSEQPSWKPFTVRSGPKTLRFKPGLKSLLLEPQTRKARLPLTD